MTWLRAGLALSVFLLALSTGVANAQHQALNPTPRNGFKAEIDKFVSADREAPHAPCQVLFIGSSSIARWTTLVNDMAPLPVINRGFGGSHIEDIIRWFDLIIAPYRPRAIVLYAGENDVAEGKSIGRVVGDFDRFMARKSAVLGSTPVYFISLKPSKLRFEQLDLQSGINAAIRARANGRSNLHFIDVVAPMLEGGKPKDLFTADNLHMTSEGYALWTKTVRATLLPNSEADAQRCFAQEDSDPYAGEDARGNAGQS